ncbi:ABC transporter ATP-binding protein [Varunaivibrio sulfuroxidans]|uniref:Amino acid/amide ABC transporter ATP-binding protein 2 (HAAT family) n=1 Tax=Varunaivibrio sulfuroxidans TaxID=1773489 RepID=A0A4R3JHB0_9PROT|nr:ABC transporter ATP-binding protein [Varunaivibrio sulfuroxidans]TCS64895.1 amino acid/amide ABC transporter ATP-binding protein 2 (HAAT family) [Varunaivibrio sulfuroxidans]WES29810.1 ABC transporter ATP-binding protein [Varunaivibrio sulfuroxidans]
MPDQRTLASQASPAPAAAAEDLLSVADLHAYYGESHVLYGVDFTVRRGELVTLLGRNGSGRTTILKSVLGLVGRRSGSVRVAGREAINLPPHRIARLGVGYCPEERGIFSRLTVEENLLLPPVVKDGGMSLDEIYALFANLLERRKNIGTRLSGGEQQMLAMARILRTGADLLLLDEITEGLAPVIVQSLGRLIRQLKVRGYTIVLVEQNFHFAADLADRHYVVDRGRIAEMIPKEKLAQSQELLNGYLGV